MRKKGYGFAHLFNDPRNRVSQVSKSTAKQFQKSSSANNTLQANPTVD